jgi:hypothetical protein
MFKAAQAHLNLPVASFCKRHPCTNADSDSTPPLPHMYVGKGSTVYEQVSPAPGTARLRSGQPSSQCCDRKLWTQRMNNFSNSSALQEISVLMPGYY